MNNHYTWLRENLTTFLKNLNFPYPDQRDGWISAHGDKCYGYRNKWEEHRIPFEHGVAIYLLTYHRPYSTEVRETKEGWINPDTWIINNYQRFREYLPEPYSTRKQS